MVLLNSLVISKYFLSRLTEKNFFIRFQILWNWFKSKLLFVQQRHPSFEENK